ncbi:MAG: hypothetical protein WC077_05205 [Bacteroidales bacterium]|jgi:hypothetical protein|nr:hypothetical protein [Bacteroidales bacterium]
MMKILIIILTLILISCEQEIEINDLRVIDLEGNIYENNLLYISQDGYMVNHIDAFTFIEYAKAHKVSEKFKKIAAGLKDTDNLVLIRVKLKNE